MTSWISTTSTWSSLSAIVSTPTEACSFACGQQPCWRIAKNYLSADEVDTLNRIVNLYLEFAELQAKAHIPMYMKDWVQKLDDFLRLSNRELLTHAGKISAEIAKRKADAEYDKFRERTKYELSPVEIHFIDQFEAEQKRLKDNGKK